MLTEVAFAPIQDQRRIAGMWLVESSAPTIGDNYEFSQLKSVKKGEFHERSQA
jgi:hypothetical protein